MCNSCSQYYTNNIIWPDTVCSITVLKILKIPILITYILHLKQLPLIKKHSAIQYIIFSCFFFCFFFFFCLFLLKGTNKNERLKSNWKKKMKRNKKQCIEGKTHQDLVGFHFLSKINPSEHFTELLSAFSYELQLKNRKNYKINRFFFCCCFFFFVMKRATLICFYYNK